MKPFVYLHGYATTFMQAEKHNDGRVMFFDPDAFGDQLANRDEAFLNFGTHDAPPITRPITLFSDRYGLGFIAAIPAAQWQQIRGAVLANKGNGAARWCSVYTVDENTEFDRLGDGTPCSRIVKARIEHVTICTSPIISGTGVWPADAEHAAMPSDLRKLRARFDVGWRQWQSRGGRSVSARRLPHDLAGMMAARAAQFQNFMGDMGGIIAARGVGAVPVFGHAAFSRAAGFDRSEFSAMIAASARPMARAAASMELSPDYWSPDAQHRRWLRGKCSTRGSLSQ